MCLPGRQRVLAKLLHAAMLTAFGLLGACATPPAAPPDPDPGVLRGVPKKDDGQFLRAHQSFLRRGQEGPVELLFLGDSITAGWSKAPAVFAHHYGQWKTANFGIGGDRAEHILWRIEHGELEHIRPRVVVLLAGTNNSGSDRGTRIAELDRLIVATIRQRLPATRVLLLAIFPRGPRVNNQGVREDATARMHEIAAANAELARLDDGNMVRFLDVGPHFLRDGVIPPELMPDQLHPGPAGYAIWAERMQPLLVEMMK